ncbi:MAG: FAD binding domain-containing protein, partial [Solirubrobacteraceae bacterium]|nr:FAD binding domain-containing protein [Solirubrobacteraceae bacterium]
MDLGTVAEIVVARGRDELLAAGVRDGDRFLAGGSWIFSEPQIGTTRLIDLTGLGWPSVAVGEDGLELAATCTLAEVARLSESAAASNWPALRLARECCEALRGSFKVWNVGTVGGNLCCALPAGPMTSLTAALDGHCLVWLPDGGERTVPVMDLVTGDGTTSLAPGEVIRSITIPARTLRQTTAFRQGSLTRL